MSDGLIPDEVVARWAARRSDDAGRLARELKAAREAIRDLLPQYAECYHNLKCRYMNPLSPHRRAEFDAVLYQAWNEFAHVVAARSCLPASEEGVDDAV